MTSATVSMPLAEIDKLRDDLKHKEGMVEALNREIQGILADKRTVLKTVIPKKEDFLFQYNVKAQMEDDYRRMSRNFCSHKDTTKLISDEEKFTKYVKIIPKNPTNIKTEYINFEDVKEELKQELETKHNEELGALRVKTQDYEQKIGEIQADYDKKLRTMLAHQYDKVEELKEVISKQEKAYKELLEGKREESKIQHLEKLLGETQKKLNEELMKPWYKKLFS